MDKRKIIGIMVVLVVVLGLIWLLPKGSGEQQVSMFEPTDTVSGFYDQWLRAVKDPASADPDLKTLAKSPILSKTLRDRLVKSQKDSNITPDPVLCQTMAPEAFSMRRVYEDGEKAQILVTSKDTSVTEQAIFNLVKLGEGWYIDDIECSPGEVAPDREFTFEKEGFLLKGSIPAPYDSKNWHLVFEENGVPGHVVPLFFDAKSECTNAEGDKSACSTEGFQEATKAFVQGQMSERGVSVNFLRLVK